MIKIGCKGNHSASVFDISTNGLVETKLIEATSPSSSFSGIPAQANHGHKCETCLVLINEIKYTKQENLPFQEDIGWDTQTCSRLVVKWLVWHQKPLELKEFRTSSVYQGN